MMFSHGNRTGSLRPEDRKNNLQTHQVLSGSCLCMKKKKGLESLTTENMYSNGHGDEDERVGCVKLYVYKKATVGFGML